MVLFFGVPHDRDMTSKPARAVTPIPHVKDISDATLQRIVTHVDRTTAAGRKKLASDPQTRMYLQAGLRLMEKQFSAESRTSPDGDETTPPFFEWISRPKVAEETRDEGFKADADGLPSEGNSDQMRRTWDPHRDYIADLLLVALALQHWSTPVYSNMDLTHALSDPEDDNFAEAVHRVAAEDLRTVTASSSWLFRIQLLAIAVADREPLIRQALDESYRQTSAGWAKVYTDTLVAKGLKLRRGITMDDITDMLTAAAEGLALQLIAKSPDASSNLLDADKNRSLLGVMALAIWMACATTEDDDNTVEDLIGLLGAGLPSD